jgi:hypothetical protein
VQGAVAALQKDDDLIRLANEVTSRTPKYYVLEAHISDFNFPRHRSYSMAMAVFAQVRDGSEEEVGLDDIMGQTEWTSSAPRRQGDLRLPARPGPIVRPLRRPAPFRTKTDTTTYVISSLLMFKMWLAKHKGEHHEMGIAAVLSLLPDFTLPRQQEQDQLDTLATALYKRSRPGMTARNGGYTPNFNLMTNGVHFTGQNVSSGNGVQHRMKSVAALGMEPVDLPHVCNSAGVFDEYVRHCKSFGSVTVASKAAGSENKRVYYHTDDTATHVELTESLEDEGEFAYDAQVKLALEHIHVKTLVCKGDVTDWNLLKKRRKTAQKKKPAPKRRRKNTGSSSSSSSSSDSSDDDEPRPSTCE